MNRTCLDSPLVQQAELKRWLQEDAGDNSQQLHRLRRKLQQARDAELTDRQRQILFMRYEQQLTPAQIALELGVHRSTVSRTLQRAQNRLYHYLQYTL